MKPKPIRVNLLWVAAFAVAGCSQGTVRPQPLPTFPTEETSPLVVLDLSDTSASNRARLSVETGEVAELMMRLDSSRTWLTVLRNDSELRELWSAPSFSSDEAFLETIVPNLAPLSGHDNTYLNLGFEQIAKRVNGCSGRCVVLISTDWFCEGMGPKEHKMLRASIDSLARAKNVVAVFVEGIDPRNSQQARSELAPLSAKLRVFPAGHLDVKLLSSLLNEEASR